jgi:divalent metal cation (Fe/Co/Zn/Cd) transporter
MQWLDYYRFTIDGFCCIFRKRNKELLIGESISRRGYKMISAIVSKIPEVNKIISIRSMHLAPEDVLIAIEVALADNLDTDAIASVIDNIESKVREIIPYANPSKIYVEPERDISSSSSSSINKHPRK